MTRNHGPLEQAGRNPIDQENQKSGRKHCALWFKTCSVVTVITYMTILLVWKGTAIIKLCRCILSLCRIVLRRIVVNHIADHIGLMLFLRTVGPILHKTELSQLTISTFPFELQRESIAELSLLFRNGSLFASTVTTSDAFQIKRYKVSSFAE